jgi:hypothetical protein
MSFKSLFTTVALCATTILPGFAKGAVDVTLPKDATKGETVTVKVHTAAKAKCKIEAQDAGMTQALKLMDKDANKEGNTSWKFDVPKDITANGLPVIVTVMKDGDEEKSTNTIQIK